MYFCTEHIIFIYKIKEILREKQYRYQIVGAEYF